MYDHSEVESGNGSLYFSTDGQRISWCTENDVDAPGSVTWVRFLSLQDDIIVTQVPDNPSDQTDLNQQSRPATLEEMTEFAAKAKAEAGDIELAKQLDRLVCGRIIMAAANLGMTFIGAVAPQREVA